MPRPNCATDVRTMVAQMMMAKREKPAQVVEALWAQREASRGRCVVVGDAGAIWVGASASTRF